LLVISEKQEPKRQAAKKKSGRRTPALQLLLSTATSIADAMGESRKILRIGAGGCVQSIANVPLSAGQSRSEKGGKRDGIEAGKE
jgi:hypothetical protein